MQNKKTIILIVLVVAISGLAVASTWSGWFTNSPVVKELPTAKEEYQRIFDRFKNDTSMNLEAVITLYDGDDPATIKEKATCRYIKRQEKCYSQFSYLQTWCNERLVVQLDTVNQVIVVSPIIAGRKKNKRLEQPTVEMLFSEQADFKIMGKVTEKNINEREISCQSDFNPEVRSYDITYDPATYKIKRATIQWWKEGVTPETASGNSVWISQIDYQPGPVVNMNIEEEISKIITIKKDQIEPAVKYQHYQLHISNPEQ